MPNQVNKITEQAGSSIYSNMDEILTKPPSSIVRYGSVTLLFLLLILCAVSFLLKYDEGITGIAHIKTDNIVQIKSVSVNAVVTNNYIQQDTILKKGDIILIVKKTNGNDTIVAPFDGKITCQRKLKQGEILQLGTLLFTIIAPQNNFGIKITIPQAYVNKIKLGQPIKISVPNYQSPQSQVISLPYLDTALQKIVVDADINFDNAVYLYNSKPQAFIIVNKKSLAKAFFGL
jgi:HlyD family secretion protein